MRLSHLALLLTFVLPLTAQQHLRDKEIHDPDTRAWWHTTEALSNDAMQGRDTGTPAYQRAADYTAARFKAAGLQPAGENGTYFQTVPMNEVAVVPEGTSFTLSRSTGDLKLDFLQQITIAPTPDLDATVSAPLTFRGYCGKDAMADIAGKIVVCFGTQREGLPSAAERTANARAGKAVGLLNVDDPFFTIEPPRWPYAYARTVALHPPVFGVTPGGQHFVSIRPHLASLAIMRLSSEAFPGLLAGSGQDAAALLKRGGTKQPLPSFEIPGTFHADFHLTTRDLSSPNILALLPGSDPTLAPQTVVASAHLDGYGFGTPVLGDNLYNGTLDDAAYVALLIQMADDFHSGKLPAPKRSILFAAFTGEEKGLLGSNWFVANPTIPAAPLVAMELVADVNLDQLRPLNILTAEALTDTTLGDLARSVATPMHIELRTDTEPERSLLRRADQFPFLKIGVPAISFIFGYDPNTDAERRYREWYQVRYHRPQDDLTQPMNFPAATKFNTFFYSLIGAIANTPTRPTILPASHFAIKK